MVTESRETIYGASIRAAAERATEARKDADRLAVEARNKRMLGVQGPAQPSPALGDALNADYRYLEVKCLGCNMHQTIALDIVRRPKTTPVHELERYMRCRQCSEIRGYRGATSSRCDPPRFPRAFHRQRGGLASSERFNLRQVMRVQFFLAVLSIWPLPVLLLANDGAPVKLRNKTIRVAWTAQRTVMTPRGEKQSPRFSQQRTIYVSSAGNVFVNSAVEGSGGTKEAEMAPGDKAAQGGGREIHFVGGKLLAMAQTANPARPKNLSRTM